MRSMTLAKLCSESSTSNLANETDQHEFNSYAITELQKDVEKELLGVPEAERDALRTKFAVFVVHNKLKPKFAELPADIP